MQKMYSFASDLIKTDVTTVKIFKNFIFFGIGNYLHVYASDTRQLVKKVFFSDEQIYNIDFCVRTDELLLYGAKTIKLFRVKFEGALNVIEVRSRECDDWILSAKFLQCGSLIAMVSMHNVATLWGSEFVELRRCECEERCILYSAHIAKDNWADVVILSGTVFNQVLIWGPEENSSGFCPVLCRLEGHKGVIFSIDYNLKNGLICSTSDDRTAILWSVQNKNLSRRLGKVAVTNRAVLHGHSARVFKCKVLDNFILTSGEDGLINIWSAEGTALRKIEAHQGGWIWSLDGDEENNVIASGGEDGGVSLFSLSALIRSEQIRFGGTKTPKKVVLLSSSNLAAVTEDGSLFYCDTKSNGLREIHTHDDLKSYSLLEKSPCGNFLALAGLHGDIHFYEDSRRGLKYKLSCQIENKARIFALHWLTCKLFLTCGPAGVLTLWAIGDYIAPIQFFRLPFSKERWTTSACLCGTGCVLIGDRRGTLYLYSADSCEPIQLIRKTHNYLGVTNVYYEGNNVISLGRNSSLNKYYFDPNLKRLSLVSSDKVPFTWLAAMYTTKSASLVLGFAGDNVIIWDYNARRTLLEKNCGGGHRSWDFGMNPDTFHFSYIKDKVIYLLSCATNSLHSSDVIRGFHVNTINSLKLLKLADLCPNYMVVSGGEDTTLRVSSTNFLTHESVTVLKSHLSSVRVISACKISESQTCSKFHVFSAGGRAQIIMWEVSVTLLNNNIRDVSCSEIHSFYEPLNAEESEIRMMDLCTLKLPEGDAILFAACSDGSVKLFSVDGELRYLHNLTYKPRCILKICCFQINKCNVLITMATDGNIAIWDVREAYSKQSVQPTYIIKAHQSGVNTCSVMVISEDSCLILTGGDDNAIALNLIRFSCDEGKVSVETLAGFSDAGVHCAQITGSYITEKYFITASVDQKLCLFNWDIQDNQISIELLNTYVTTICDIQGMECVTDYNDDLKVIVYGNGFEMLSLSAD